jgi:fatty acid desaturase
MSCAIPETPLSSIEARRAVAGCVALDDLRELSTAHRLRDLAVFVGMWGVGVALALWGLGLDGLWRVAAMGAGVVTSALALNAFVLLLHEGMHGVLFQSPALNRVVSVLLGATVLMSFSAYRTLHTQHHDELGTDDDPDDYHAYTDRAGVFWLLQYVRLTVGCFLYLLAVPLTALRRGSRSDRVGILIEYPVIAALVALAVWALPPEALLWGWLAPLPLVALFVQVRGLTQHGLTDRHDALLASRTVRPHPVVAFLLLNENYHLEHHLFPEVPSYHLPELHRRVWPVLPRAVEGDSYLGFLGAFARATPALDETPIGVVAPAER